MEEDRLEMVVRVNAILNLQHTDIPATEHSIEEVRGEKIYHRSGKTEINFDTISGTNFSNISGLICVLTKIKDLFNGKKKQGISNTNPKNILELSPNGYGAIWRFDFEGEDNYAQKTSQIEFVREVDGVKYYNETITTIHHYPKSLSNTMVRILPDDIVLLNSQQSGKLYGKTILRWLKNNGDILSVPADVKITLEDSTAYLDCPQLFSYEYKHISANILPFDIEIMSKVSFIEED